MFIIKDSDSQTQVLNEADELKPVCEVHGGNLFVQLHFKAIKSLPDSVELINTAVTSKDEQSAKFQGCGKHLIAVRSTDEDNTLVKADAFKYIRNYVGVMLGQDVSNQLKDDDVTVILENGQTATPEDLKKWEEQQKNSKDKDDDKDQLDESIPSFGRFILEDSDEAGDGDEGEAAGDGDEDEAAGEDDEDEVADEEIPPPATYITCYTIQAKGQPEKDHTDTEKIKEIDHKLKMPEGNFNIGLGFGVEGGGFTDTLDFKKLGKELKGEIDSDKIESQIKTIFRGNFPNILIPTVEIRDNRTLKKELDRRKSEGSIKNKDCNSKLDSAMANARYSVFIEVKDYREKPQISKKDIHKIINVSLKKIGGRRLKRRSSNGLLRKLLSLGIKEDDIFLVHGLSAMSKDRIAIDKVRRMIPTPDEIQSFIDKKHDSVADLFAKIDQKFENCRKENNKVGEKIASDAVSKWENFKKKHSSDKTTESDFQKFQSEYKDFYSKAVLPLLNNKSVTEHELMKDIFGILYEEDGAEDSEESADEEQEEEEEKEESTDGQEDGAADQKKSGKEQSGKKDDKEEEKEDDQVTNIFIIPMKHLDVDMEKSRF